VLFADAFSRKLKEAVDAYILQESITAPAPEEDPNDRPDENASCASPLTTLSLKAANIGSVVWASGFTGDFAYLKLPVFKEEKIPNHHNGISEVGGLYFLGLPWLRKRKSAIIYGIGEDAAFIAQQVLQYGERYKATPSSAGIHTRGL
jgi:putative flavoprotein involved in K+ transport